MPLKEGDLIKGRYEVLEKLGDGCYAKVYLVMDRKDAQVYAIKAINKRHLAKNRELGPNLYRETKIHKAMEHENIVRFYKELDDDHYIYFLLEAVSPGELFSELYERDDDSDSEESHEEKIGFSESETRDYIKQLIAALIYLRDRNVIHRDLKPENLLVNEYGVLKLADFGWATDRKSKSIVGTDTYNAPEMLKRREYNYKSDIWSLGIILFEFLYQKRPFKGRNEKATERLILRAKVEFPRTPHVSREAKDLICRIFTLNPEERPDYEEILAHPWMQKKSSHSRRRRTKSTKSAHTEDEEEEQLDLTNLTLDDDDDDEPPLLEIPREAIQFNVSAMRPN